MQVAATGSRKLFDAGRREVFLEWFAATCNVKLSAAKAGVAYQTVFKHRMKDAAFEAAWDAALRQGYARIEARLVQEVDRTGTSIEEGPSTACGGPPPHPAEPGREEPTEEQFDAQLALQLLREHARRLPGVGDKRKNLRTTAVAATNAEIADALAKRLKSFGLRTHLTRHSRESGNPAASPDTLEGEKRDPRFREGDEA